MSRRKKLTAYVRILQNGSPVCEVSRPLDRGTTLSLSPDLDGSLPLPLYPLPENIPLLRIRRGEATLLLTQPWEGLVVSRGQANQLNRNQSRSQEFSLGAGDYATLVWEDLRAMIKVVSPPPASPAVAAASGYGGSVAGLWFHDQQEKVALAVATLLGGAIMACLIVGLLFYRKMPPRVFEELADSYTLPFVNGDNLATSPEGLQKNLDRKNYIGSVVAHYRNVTKLFMGWPLDDERFVFASSQKLYGGYYAAQEQALAELVDSQLAADRSLRGQAGSSLVAIPSVYGESFQQRLLKVIAKVDKLHASYRMALEHRRKTHAAFRADPAYDWNAYLLKNDGLSRLGGNNAKATQEIAKVEVFHQETNEQAMYSEAERLGRSAALMQHRLGRSMASQQQLEPTTVKPIYIPAGVPFASFLHSGYSEWSDQALGALQGSEFGKKTEAKPLKEPLIGQIAPEAISRAVYNHRYELNLCYEFALRRNQSLEGSMDWSWRIDSLGKISDISLVTTSLRDQQMIDCVKRKLASWAFPRPRRGSVKVFHTFEFKPQSG